ncbi:MAG TPA: SHOCT domain-containing protein [Terriglobales bacterium]|nr:SHOCT domain-containing protein [Terriglobales bacterium]
MALATLFLQNPYYRGWWGGGWWWIWWVVWILIIVLAFAWWAPWSADHRVSRLTPIEVLQHRLARGEITPEEYERRRELLDRDRKIPPAA